MTDVAAVVDRHADEYEVRDRLHAVPPYEVYEVVVDGRRAVCKVDAHPRGHAATEGRVQAWAAAETATAVPEVLAVGADHYLAAWSEDAPPQDVDDLDRAPASAIGAGMAWFHQQAAFESYGLPRPSADAPSVTDCDGLPVEAFDDWPATVDALLAESEDFVAEQGYGDVVAAVREFVRAHPEIFDGVGDPVLCHGNWLPEHVGVETGDAGEDGRGRTGPGTVTCVIDFEHALVAPPAYDVWRALGPLSNHGVADAFRAGYEAVRDLPAAFERRKPAFQVVNVVRYLEALYLQDRVDRAEAERKADRMREFAYERLDQLAAGVEG